MKGKVWINRVKWNKGALLCALFHYLLSFFTDRFFFSYTVLDFSNGLQSLKSVETVGVKILFLVLLLFLWQGIFFLFRKADKTFFRIAAGYFLVNVLLLLLIWPGIWRMDEFGLLSSALHLYPNFWQCYLTSVFYIFALMILPFPAGVILVQCAVISLLAARCVTRAGDLLKGLWKTVENSPGELPENSGREEIEQTGQDLQKGCKSAGLFSKETLILLIPLVMFPVLDSNLYPMRMSIWAFLELTILLELAGLYQNGIRCGARKNNRDFARFPANRPIGKDNELSDDFSTTSVVNCGKLNNNIYVICIAAALLTVWRTEAIYYLVLFPTLLLFIFLKDLRSSSGEKASDTDRPGVFRQAMPALLAYFISFVILFIPQQIGNKLTSGSQYELTGMVLPLAELVSAADPSDEKDAALLSEIDQVIDVELTRRGVAEGKNGINLFWGEPDFQRQYTDADFSACKKAYYALVLRYPSVFIKERWKTFWESRDLLMDTTALFSEEDNPNYTAFRAYPLSRPLSEGVRSCVIRILELRDLSDYNKKLPIANAVYDPALPLLILLCFLAFSLVKKKYFAALLLVTSLLKAPLIFLTAPSRLFMYYYPVYLTGWFLLFLGIAWVCCKRSGGSR